MKFNVFCKFEDTSFKTQNEILKGPHGFLLSGRCTIGLRCSHYPHEFRNHGLLGLKLEQILHVPPFYWPHPSMFTSIVCAYQLSHVPLTSSTTLKLEHNSPWHIICIAEQIERFNNQRKYFKNDTYTIHTIFLQQTGQFCQIQYK